MRIIVATALVVLSMISAAHGQPPDIGMDQPLNAQVPLDLAFRDEKGDAVALGSYFGERPVILVLAYYRCPRLCSLTLNNLAASLGKVDYRAGRDYAVVIVSID